MYKYGLDVDEENKSFPKQPTKCWAGPIFIGQVRGTKKCSELAS